MREFQQGLNSVTRDTNHVKPAVAEAVCLSSFFFVINPLIELPSLQLRIFVFCDLVEKWKTYLNK